MFQECPAGDLFTCCLIATLHYIECVNSSVAGFAKRFLWKFPRLVGHTTGAVQEENCQRNLHKNFLANLATELLTDSVFVVKSGFSEVF